MNVIAKINTPSRAMTAVHLGLIVLVGLMAYANSFGAGFHFDDTTHITQNPYITTLEPFFFTNDDPRYDLNGKLLRRYIGYLSLAVNYHIHQLDVTGYHVGNLLIHLLMSFVVYAFVRVAFRTPGLRGSALAGDAPLLGLLGALLFVAHPVQTQAVTYIIQRFASLSAMFYMMSVVLYICLRIRGQDADGLPSLDAKGISIYALSIFSAACAMITKEPSITLPGAIAAVELTLFSGPLKKRLLVALPILMTIFIAPCLLMYTGLADEIPVGGQSMRFDAMTENAGMTRLEYHLTELSVLMTYLRLLLLPVNQVIEYDYPITQSALSARAGLAIAFHLVFAGAGFWLMRLAKRHDPSLRLIALAVFWFYITTSVEAFGIILDIIFEHRVYLPSAVVLPAMAVGLMLLVRSLSPSHFRRYVAGILVVAVAVLGAATYKRNMVWKDEMSLWSDAVEKSPGLARAHNNLANAYYLEKDYDRAIKHYSRAVQIKPRLEQAQYNLGFIYMSLGRNEEAKAQFKKTLEINPAYPGARQFLNYLENPGRYIAR